MDSYLVARWLVGLQLRSNIASRAEHVEKLRREHMRLLGLR